MKRNRIPSFRGLRAAIEHPPGADRTMLQSQLERLGLIVTAGHCSDRRVDPAPDVFFFDGDGIDGHCQPDAAALPRNIPLVALIGSEAPGRLEALFTLQPSAYLTKPIRRTGVYSCLAIAILHYELRRHMNERLLAAEQRISHRRKVISAVVKLMQCEALSEDVAYRTLQRAAMSRRQSIEALSIDLVTGRRAITDVLAGIEGCRRSELG